MNSTHDDAVCLCLASVPSDVKRPCVCRTQEFGGELLRFATTAEGTIDFMTDDPLQRACECELDPDFPKSEYTVLPIWEDNTLSSEVTKRCKPCQALQNSLYSFWATAGPFNAFVDAWCRNKRGFNTITPTERKVLRQFIASSITGKREWAVPFSWDGGHSVGDVPSEMLHFPIVVQRLAKHGWFVDGCVQAATMGIDTPARFELLKTDRDARERFWRLWSVDRKVRWIKGKFISKRMHVHDDFVHGWNCVSTLMFAVVRPTKATPLEKFVKSDGDHAVCARVLGCLV